MKTLQSKQQNRLIILIYIFYRRYFILFLIKIFCVLQFLISFFFFKFCAIKYRLCIFIKNFPKFQFFRIACYHILVISLIFKPLNLLYCFTFIIFSLPKIIIVICQKFCQISYFYPYLFLHIRINFFKQNNSSLIITCG